MKRKKNKLNYKEECKCCKLFSFVLTCFLIFSQNSHMQNQARIRVLKAREEHIRNVVEEARHKLMEVTKDPGLYKNVLQKLIAQVDEIFCLIFSLFLF